MRFAEAAHIEEAVLCSGRRLLRSIPMITFASALAMSPLAWGIRHGVNVPRPLAIILIGVLCILLVFSLNAPLIHAASFA